MSPRRTIPQKKEQGGLPPWLIVAAIGAVAIIAVLLAADFISKIPSSVAPSNISAGSRTKGEASAKVEMIEFSDFQ